MLLSILSGIPDHRRAQGRRYQLGHILLFTVFAILSGATSYRKVHTFISVQYRLLNELFGLNWKRIPAYSGIRKIIQGVDPEELESCFRQHAASLRSPVGQTMNQICLDGKVLKGSFDNFNDQKSIQVLSAFLCEETLILAHEFIAEKSNEIPAAQRLIEALGLQNCLFTADAMHCQKKRLI